MKIVLENDGTEVDDKEYFGALERNTCFVALKVDEDWMPSAHSKETMMEKSPVVSNSFFRIFSSISQFQSIYQE